MCVSQVIYCLHKQGISKPMLFKFNNKFILQILILVFAVVSLALVVNTVFVRSVAIADDHHPLTHQSEMQRPDMAKDGTHMAASSQCDECADGCSGMDCAGSCTPCSGAVLLCLNTLQTVHYTSAYSLFPGRFMPGTHLPPQKQPPRTIAV